MDTSTIHSIEWDLDRYPLRDLSSKIVTDRIDEVLVTASDVNVLRSIERLGYPIEPCAPTASSDNGVTRVSCLLLPDLNRSVLPIKEYTYSVSYEDVEAYGKSSGDMNPVHFDDDAARAQGFEGRISHGMLFNGWFTRLLGMEYPGPGTIYLRSQCLFMAPMYPEREYHVRVSTPRHDAKRGYFRIVAQLLNGVSGIHSTIAYADVLNR